MSGSRSIAVVLCLGLLGCPQTASPTDSTSGASANSTGGASTGSSGSQGSGSTGTSGPGTTGTTGTLIFSEQGLPSGTDGVNGIHGRSAADVWAVTSGGAVLHSTGATWTRVYQTNSNLGLSSVFAGADGRVWAGGEAGFFVCNSHCTDADAAPFFAVDLQGASCRSLASLCGRGSQVFALCDQQGAGALLTEAAGAWSTRTETNAYVLDRCAVLPDGKVLISAQGQIFRYDPNLGVSADAIHFPAGTRSEYAYFSALWGDGAHEFASTNGGRIYSWSAGDHAWLPLLRPTAINSYADDPFTTIVGVDSAATVYALGRASDDHPAARWDGTDWSDLLSFGGDGYSYFSGWAAGTDDLFLGGVRRNTNDGFIVHAHR